MYKFPGRLPDFLDLDQALSLGTSYGAPVPALSISYVVTSHDRLVVTLPEVEARIIGASLKRRSERPVGQANTRAMAFCAAAFVMMLVTAGQSPDPIAAVRAMAILFVAIQGAVHYISTASLRTLSRLGVREAVIGLAAYRDPRRLSCMDMAMMWTAVALTAPYFR